MNYIIKNQELERVESYFKNLSNHLKETYEERGKYLFVGRFSYLMTAEVFVSFLLLGVIIAKSIPFVIATALLFFTIYFFTGLALYGENILEKAKLPIISKKRFLKNFLKRNSLDLQSDLDSLNLTFYDLVIDDTNLEIRLNYSRPWFKNTKR